jgi:hypothetical protein
MTLTPQQQVTLPVLGVGSIAGVAGAVGPNVSLNAVETQMPTNPNGAYSVLTTLGLSGSTPSGALSQLRLNYSGSGSVCIAMFSNDATLNSALAGVGRACFDSVGPLNAGAIALATALSSAAFQANLAYTIQFDVGPKASASATARQRKNPAVARF